MTISNLPKSGGHTEHLHHSPKSLSKAVSLNADLAVRLSQALHSRPEFEGKAMATVAFKPGSSSSDLQIVFADDTRSTAARLSRTYELTSEILRSSSEGRCTRFVISQEGSQTVPCGVSIYYENAPVAVIVWADLHQAMPLLDMIEEAVNQQVRFVTASGSRLSQRELEVIAMSADGMTSAEIAFSCAIAETTVNAHIARAMKRTKARSRTQLISIAIRNGYI